MNNAAISATSPSTLSPSPPVTKSLNRNSPPPSFSFRPLSKNPRFKFSICLQISKRHFNLYPYKEDSSSNSTSGFILSRLRTLVSEFKSLSEPIDRVKRLLDYAVVLPQVTESFRVPGNRVAGCAAQVWLDVEIDEFGLMRFKADSDSEITKGFCSCLIFLLDGAYPEEVLKVKAEDLADMNVGLPVRSRVNSWNNVLIAMQERTKATMAERVEMSSLEPFPPIGVPVDSGVIGKGEAFVS